MSSWWYRVDTSGSKEGLNPLLPHIAGVIESVQEATFVDIKSQVETDLGKKVSDSDIVRALENGIKLGVFNRKREFKVCREFTTKEIKKVKQMENTEKNVSIPASKKERKSLMDYVKHERAKRRKKLHKKGKRAKNMVAANDFCGKNELYKYLCQRCRESLEKEMTKVERTSDTSSGDENGHASKEDCGSSASEASSVTKAKRKFSSQGGNPKEKSKLLVEKSPMETDPPYCDIFT